MDVIKGKSSPPEVRWKVGSQVRFTIGLAEYTGRVVEDRGKIGVGGRRLYGIAYREDEDEPSYIELPAVEMRPL